MAFGGFEQESGQPMAEINTTPLVDVMLVLLVIFMVTAPLFTHAVKIDLPRAQSQLNPDKPETISIAIDAAGKIYWNDQPVIEDALFDRFTRAATATPQPELHLRADRETRYQVIARVMAGRAARGVAKDRLRDRPEREEARAQHAVTAAIPINLLTGYLGSGKTTLLSRLLAHPHLEDTAVLVNEFGEIALDHQLLFGPPSPSCSWTAAACAARCAAISPISSASSFPSACTPRFHSSGAW